MLLPLRGLEGKSFSPGGWSIRHASYSFSPFLLNPIFRRGGCGGLSNCLSVVLLFRLVGGVFSIVCIVLVVVFFVRVMWLMRSEFCDLRREE